MKKALVVGASGATGKLLVAELLNRDFGVIAIVRASSSLRSRFGHYSDYHEVSANISEMTEAELTPHLAGCEVVFSCLGHKLTFQGMFGKPRRLVADTMEKLSRVIHALKPDKKVMVILMNTSGNSNRDLPENPPLSQRMVISLLRVLIPPHIDNEKAADFLRTRIGQHHQFIEWTAVRPGSLTDEAAVTKYVIQPSPARNVIFDDGTTSRINVAHFMASLSTDADLRCDWRGKMPVIYNDG